MAGIPGFPVLMSGKVPAPVTSVLSAAIGSFWGALFPGERWGIYAPGSETPILSLDSVVELGINCSSEVSSYKIETGSFASYNKVRNPTTIMLRATKEGRADIRAEIVEWLALEVTFPSLWDVVMPEKRYTGYTVVDYRIMRNSSSGAGLIVADITLQEVREIIAVYSNSNIEDPNNQPSSPASRVQLGEPIEPVQDVQWGYQESAPVEEFGGPALRI